MTDTPDTSAQAVERYGAVRVTKVRKAFQDHREAIASGDLEMAQETWGRCEEWMGWAHGEASTNGALRAALTAAEAERDRMREAVVFAMQSLDAALATDRQGK